MAWVWPMPVLPDGRAPKISDGYHVGEDGTRHHPGCDVMYRRLPTEPAQLPNGSRGHFCPAGTRVLAVDAGVVVVSHDIGTGGQVRVKHADGRLSDYKHLARRFVEPGAEVRQGQELGIVGGNVKPGAYPLVHLHFEARTAAGTIFDPGPLLTGARAITPRASSAAVAAALVAAKLGGLV